MTSEFTYYNYSIYMYDTTQDLWASARWGNWGVTRRACAGARNDQPVNGNCTDIESIVSISISGDSAGKM